MIKLAYCNVENLDLKKAYNLVSRNRQEKIDFYRFEKDKKLSAGAYLLLKKLLSDANIKSPVFKTGKYGKAYISNFENIYFNLSHSSKIVLCAISDKEVGVDVEYIDPAIDLNIAKNYFYNTEYELSPETLEPEVISEDTNIYWILAGNLRIGDIVYQIPLSESLEKGVYSGTIVTETISPMSLLLN